MAVLNTWTRQTTTILVTEGVLPAAPFGFDAMFIVDGVTNSLDGDRVRVYLSFSAVEADGPSGNGYLDAASVDLARVFFAQRNPQPQRLKFGRWDSGSETPLVALNAIDAADCDFYGTLLGSRTAADQVALSTAVEAFYRPLVCVLQSADADWLTSGYPAAWTAVEDRLRTMTVYHDDGGFDGSSAKLDAAVLGKWLGRSPDSVPDGSVQTNNMTVREVAALTAQITDAQKGFLAANRASAAMELNSQLVIREGRMQDDKFGDRRLSIDWFDVRVREAVDASLQSYPDVNGKLPADSTGISVIVGDVNEVIARGRDARHLGGTEPGAVYDAPNSDLPNGLIAVDARIETLPGISSVLVNIRENVVTVAA